MSRGNHAMVIVGRKRTGKSTLANKIASSKAYKNRRVLIINVNNSPAYNEHPVISYPEMMAWKGSGTYQFYDRDHERMFARLLEIFKPERNRFNGLILFEDCTKYIESHPSKQIKSFLVDHRMWNADLLFTFHSLTMVPPFFWQMTSKLILLKTQDILSTSRVRQFEERIPNWKDVSPALERVNKHKSNYYHEVINTEI